MTIRLRCAECKRKLKVPDEALGKKVQCPACGARFIGRIEARPPAAPAGSLTEESLVDSIFAEMASSPPREAEAVASEPLEPMTVEDEAAMEIIEDAVEEEAPEEAMEEEDEPAQDGKTRQAKKKSKKLLFIGLACAFGLLLVCGGVALVIYRFINETL
jgi:DNA-directed RNA polymerase subunit RPC12/RpoP